jgi:hypothetical protein
MKYTPLEGPAEVQAAVEGAEGGHGHHGRHRRARPPGSYTPSHFHGGDLLPFRDLSLFLSQLGVGSLIF